MSVVDNSTRTTADSSWRRAQYRHTSSGCIDLSEDFARVRVDPPLNARESVGSTSSGSCTAPLTSSFQSALCSTAHEGRPS